MWFVGLQAYEVAAAADYERTQDANGSEQEADERRSRQVIWEKYRTAICRRNVPSEQRVRTKARELAKKNPDNAYAFKNQMKTAIDAAVAGELERLKLAAHEALTEDEFLGFANEEQLRQAIQDRHGEDLLAV